MIEVIFNDEWVEAIPLSLRWNGIIYSEGTYDSKYFSSGTRISGSMSYSFNTTNIKCSLSFNTDNSNTRSILKLNTPIIDYNGFSSIKILLDYSCTNSYKYAQFDAHAILINSSNQTICSQSICSYTSSGTVSKGSATNQTISIPLSKAQEYIDNDLSFYLGFNLYCCNHDSAGSITIKKIWLE